jgi:hypothetical protein
MSKFSRQIRRLQKLARTLKPGSVPGAFVDSTTAGTFIRPMGRSRVRSSQGGGIARYH